MRSGPPARLGLPEHRALVGDACQISKIGLGNGIASGRIALAMARQLEESTRVSRRNETFLLATVIAFSTHIGFEHLVRGQDLVQPTVVLDPLRTHCRTSLQYLA